MADTNVDMTEIKSKVSKGLEVARWKLLDQFPFTGEMALRFQIVPTYDCRCETAATDGKYIYFDCDFYSRLTEGQREFVVAHEIWHNIYLHFKRRQTRDPEMWNIATDCEINHMLANEGLEVLEDACFPDPCVAGQSAEDIYAYLQKQQQKQPKNNKGGKQGQGDGQGQGSGSSSKGGKSGSSSSSSSQNSKENKGDASDGSGDGNEQGNQNGSGSGNNKTEHGNQFDKHMFPNEGAGDGNQNSEGKFGKRGIDPDFTPSMSNPREIEDKIKEAVVSAAQSIERKQGHLPGGIAEMVKEMLKPEINWKEALSQFVTKTLGGDHSWKRVSRHALARGHYLPGQMDEKIKCAVCVDTSGSCLQDIPKFLGELNSLLHTFGKFDVTLVQADAEVQSVEHFTECDEFEPKKFQVRGCGGTSFKPFFKYLRENGDDYNCVIYLTDGYGDAPKYPPPYPTLWVLTADGYEQFCDWGEKMKFKPSKEYN